VRVKPWAGLKPCRSSRILLRTKRERSIAGAKADATPARIPAKSVARHVKTRKSRPGSTRRAGKIEGGRRAGVRTGGWAAPGPLELLCAFVGPLSKGLAGRIARAAASAGGNNHARFSGTSRVLRVLVIVDKERAWGGWARSCDPAQHPQSTE